MSISAMSTFGAQTPTPIGLVLRANGEYSGASVAANPGLAFGLIRQIDGGYAYATPSAVKSAPPVQAALLSLKMGG